MDPSYMFLIVFPVRPATWTDLLCSFNALEPQITKSIHAEEISFQLQKLLPQQAIGVGEEEVVGVAEFMVGSAKGRKRMATRQLSQKRVAGGFTRAELIQTRVCSVPDFLR
jgi:hypothetical protein